MYRTREDRVAAQVRRARRGGPASARRNKKLNLDPGFSSEHYPSYEMQFISRRTQEPIDILTEEVGWEAVEYERGVQSVGRSR